MDELPKYRCHKKVWALKLTSISEDEDTGHATLRSGDASREVDDRYMRRHEPEIGGYWVKYADGYESYSPAKAFEEGYTLIDGQGVRD